MELGLIMSTQPAPTALTPERKRRDRLVNLHLALAAFFLPFAALFVITGALYTISIKGSYNTREETVALSEPLEADLASLVAVATTALEERGVGLPSGGASVKKMGDAFQLEWTGSNRDVILQPGATAGEAILQIKDTTPYRRLVQLHKAKGSAFAKAVSVIWAAGLALMIISGLCMIWSSTKHLKIAGISCAAGVGLFVLYVLLG